VRRLVAGVPWWMALGEQLTACGLQVHTYCRRVALGEELTERQE